MKSTSYLLLVLLGLILFFILGVRYGQKVEKANKIINYVLSITPTQVPTPTPFKYATAESKIWRIKYMYPDFLKFKEDSTKSAVLFEP